MSYTCGAATTDSIGMVIKTFGADATSCFIAGWWKPTTLTSTRTLWSTGSIFGAEINSTTSEIRLKTDNTTDGEWVTTGTGLTTNEWKFLAFANTCSNTGPTAAWRVWVGTVDTIPTEVTVTQVVAPVGAFTGSSAATLGNKSGGTAAFQGEIGLAVIASHSSDLFGYVPTATIGTITQDEADLIYTRLVLPIWVGEWCPPWLRQPRVAGTAMFVTSLDYALPHEVDILTSGLFNPFDAITLNGVTLSQERCPRPMPQQVLQPRYVRR